MAHFIHFGCWNNDGCVKDTDLKKTMNTIKNFIERNKIDFAVIAGDNYYPEKIETASRKAYKNINSKIFLSGIKCLLDAVPDKVKLYVLLGNHEFDDVKYIDNEKYDFVKCHIFKQQQAIFRDIANTYFFTDVEANRIKDTLILFIDSTIYEEEGTKQIDSTCLKHIFKKIERNNSIEALRKYQEHKVKEILIENKKIENLIIACHHPIISIKSKKTGKSIGLINLYKEIYTALENKATNIYHLCADTHLYQKGLITITGNINVIQYICGTGGANKDDCPSGKLATKLTDSTCNYTMEECEKVNGFLSVIIPSDSDKIQFNFIKTGSEPVKAEEKQDEEDQDGGDYYSYKNKYLKYKNKYLQLKYGYVYPKVV